MGGLTRQRQRIRPYKKLLLLPYVKLEGIHHADEPDWRRQNKLLSQFMVKQENELNIHAKPLMIPVWILKCKNFIKENNLTHYIHRIR